MSLFIKGDITIEELQSAMLIFKGHEIIELLNHGDLVDRNMLIDEAEFVGTAQFAHKYTGFPCGINLVEWLKLAPVVISADRSE